MRVSPSSLLLVGLLGCASEPVPVADAGPIGEVLEVRLLGGGFVEFDGHRKPLEDLIYELRVRCRSAAGDAAARPWLRVVAASDAAPDCAATVQQLRDAAFDAGLHHVELVTES